MAVERSANEVYDDAFYDQAILWQGPAAFRVALAIVEEYRPDRVIDVGCGPGTYVVQLRLLGVEVSGFEWSAAAIRRCRRQGLAVTRTDLTRPVECAQRFDLALCFEVGEHLPRWASTRLVETVTDHSDAVVFTAATPGQGGVGHVNEQPLAYWDRLFSDRGYALEFEKIEALKGRFETIPEVNPWLLTNLRCYRRAARPGVEWST